MVITKYEKVSNELGGTGQKMTHKIINDCIATIINTLTNKVVMEAEFDYWRSTWNVFPDRFVLYEFRE